MADHRERLPHPFPEEGGLSREAYAAIRKGVRVRHAELAAVVVILLDLALAWVSILLLQSGNPYAYALAQLLLVVVYFHGFGILHDAGHGAVSKRRATNVLVGHWASVFCFLPFYPWKFIHQEHHTWAGNIVRDPTLELVKGFDPHRWFRYGLLRFCWVLWIPLSGVAQHFVFWFYPFKLLASPKVDWGKKSRCVFSMAFLLLVYAALHWMAPSLFHIRNFWPSMLLYMVVVELVNLPHHLGTEMTDDERGKLPVWRQAITTRSCYYPFPVSEILFLNFNFHVEHHVFPNLPWWTLRGLRQQIRDRTSGYQECLGISWNLRNRRKDLIEVAVPEWRRRRENPDQE